MSMSTLEARVASLRLDDDVGWKHLIDLDLSESSTRLSPTSDKSSLDVTSSNGTSEEVDLLDGDVRAATLSPTPVEHIIHNLPTTGPHPLLHHLSHHPVTPADVEALVPALITRTKIMNQLVVNIGYSHACGLILASDLEKILIHILAVGDERHCLYEMTKASIYGELEEHGRRGWWLWDQQQQHVEHIPQHQQRRGRHRGHRQRTGNTDIRHCESIGDFSRSRLHNGPGLTDRKYPKVRLPKGDVRCEGVSKDVLLVEDVDRGLENDELWVRSRCGDDELFDEMGDEGVVVRLPSKEAGSEAKI
jgi:hypothetical protein